MQFLDQIGRNVMVSAPPQRIISLVPSQTELLFDLGLKSKVVGITKFCIHPHPEVISIPKIGGTKQFSFEAIVSLKPDLIIGNKEENYQEGIEYLEKKYPVWMSDIYTLEDSLEMMQSIGTLLDVPQKANALVENVRLQFSKLSLVKNAPTVAYFIWRKPWMVAAPQTFIDEMLRLIGFQNIFSDLSRYPEISLELLQTKNPDYIFLSSEPYPFKEKHIQELQALLPQTRIVLVDGEMFSWYGSRLLHSVSYFKEFVATL